MATPVLMPKLGLTMESGKVVSWKKREGEPVAKGETLLEVETDKIVSEVQSPQAGFLLKVLEPEEAEVKVQAVLAVIGEKGEDISSFLAAPGQPSAPAVNAPAEAAEAPSLPAAGRLRITPRARKLLAERGFAPADLEAPGVDRIGEADVQDFLARQGQIRPMSRIEKVAAERMTASFRDIPQFSLRFKAELDRLLDLLPHLKAEAGRHITVNDLILRGVAIALSRFPEVQCQARGEGLFQPGSVNLGFAVALDRGLVVPVIRDAGGKRLAALSREAAELSERAKEQRLRPEDVSGGTFTVSNLGMFGICSFVPIVNPGEGAILGVGGIQSVTAGRVVELTLVCDHRSVNGATGAGFCRELKSVLEAAEEAAW